MTDNDAPGAGPVWTPVAQLAGFIRKTSIHCCTQNMKALVFVVRRRGFYISSHCKSIEANDPSVGAIFDPRGMVGRIYNEGLVVSEKIFYVFPITLLGPGPVWTQGARLVGFMKRTTRHCCIQKYERSGAGGFEEE